MVKIKSNFQANEDETNIYYLETKLMDQNVHEILDFRCYPSISQKYDKINYGDEYSMGKRSICFSDASGSTSS